MSWIDEGEGVEKDVWLPDKEINCWVIWMRFVFVLSLHIGGTKWFVLLRIFSLFHMPFVKIKRSTRTPFLSLSVSIRPSNMLRPLIHHYVSIDHRKHFHMHRINAMCTYDGIFCVPVYVCVLVPPRDSFVFRFTHKTILTVLYYNVKWYDPTDEYIQH